MLLATVVPTLRGDVILFDANGFESPTFAPGILQPQQGLAASPSTTTAAAIQGTTVFEGTQALQISGLSLVSDLSLSGGNFWYKSSAFGSAFGPVLSGSPYVRVEFDFRTSGALQFPTDMPLAGLYMDSYTGTGTQQSVTPILINSLGGLTVFSNSATGGADQVLSTTSGLFPRDSWQSLTAEFNFNAQTFRVYANGSATPLAFYDSPLSPTPVLDVPFRNSFGSSARIAELGFVAYNGIDFQALNDFFVDNALVTASATAIPEPGAIGLVGAGALAGLFMRRLRRSGVASACLNR